MKNILSLRNSIMVLLSLVIFIAAQPFNLKTKVLTITEFSNDSLRTSEWFYPGDYEGLSVVIKSPAVDSSVFAACYQRGYPDGSGNIRPKRPATLIDTFNTLVSGNFSTIGSWNNFYGDSSLAKAIDTIAGSGSVYMCKELQVYRSPFARVFLKGLTGNKKTNYSVVVVLSYIKYLRTEENQPIGN